MLFRVWLCSALVAVAALLAGPAAAERRVALVIGNGAYSKVPRLDNPTNDARAMEGLLKAAGFDKVVRADNLSAVQMRRALRDFSDEVRDADIAVVFYAGHGMEMNGTNYLIPVDAVLERDIDVADETVSLERINQVLEQAKRLRLVILDACRDNPFVRSMRRTLAGRAIGRGLAPVEVATTDTLIAYAAKAGSTAADGDGGNSPYTAAMVKHLATPGLDVRLALGRVRDEVLRTTSRRQEPFVYGSLGGTEVPLIAAAAKPGSDPAGLPPRPGPSAPPRQGSDPQGLTPSAAAEAWGHAKDSRSVPELEAFVRRFGDTYFGDLAKARLEALKREAAAKKRAEEEEARRRDPVLALVPGSGQSAKDCAECPEMVVVPAGSFTMGSNESEQYRPPISETAKRKGLDREYNREAKHAVAIARPFAIGKFEVTSAEWNACVRSSGCTNRLTENDAWQPAFNVSWSDAQEYVRWLSRKTGQAYRLPTEAEWEYAARAESTTPFWWGSTISTKQANYDGNRTYPPHGPGKGDEYRQRTVRVDSFDPNPWGLYNVHGNVAEWVEDCLRNYDNAPLSGPAAPGSNCQRVARGGHWRDWPTELRSAARASYADDFRHYYLGFRVGRTLTP